MQTINNLPGKGLSSETMRGGFHVDTIEHPNPGSGFMEEWREISGYEGLYQVSDYGNIKSFQKNPNGQITRSTISKVGYSSIALYNNSVFKRFYVHRLVAKAFIPNPLNKPEVNHKNGVKSDNKKGNIEWCTR